MVDGEVVTFNVEKSVYEDEFILDEELQKQLEAEFEAYEATLSDKEITLLLWKC